MKNIVVTGNLYGNMKTLKQINKIEAKRLYSEGITVFLQSSNHIPFQPYQNVCPTSKHLADCMSSFDVDSNISFGISCESYSKFNCNTKKGNYLHYFKII